MQPYAALLLLVAIATTAIASTVATHAKAIVSVPAVLNPVSNPTEYGNDIHGKDNNAASKEEDERGFNIPALSKLKNALDLKRVEAWARKDKTPDDVFKLLKLGEGVDTLLDGKKLQLWSVYVQKYKAVHPSNDMTMLEMFSRTYGADKVMKMLESAKRKPSTQQIATRMGEEHILEMARQDKNIEDYLASIRNDAWMREKKTPGDIFKLLKLDDDITTLLSNPKLQQWSSFMKHYNVRDPENEVTVLGMFTKTYGDAALAKMFETAKHNPSTQQLAAGFQEEQMVAWVANGLSTDVVFKMLKLDEGSVEGLLANPALSVWCKYFTSLNQYNADKSVTMIKKLLDTYEDIPLATAIMAATKNNKSQKTIAATLQEAQFQKWLLDGKTPNAISQAILKDRANWEHQDIVQVYKAFYRDRL